MAQFQHIHTADLSASLTCSSVAESISLSETMASEAHALDKENLVQKLDDALSPQIVDLLSNMFLAKKFEVAVEVALNVLPDHPNSVFLHNLLGEGYAQLGENLKAIGHFEQVLATAPKPKEKDLQKFYAPNAHNNLGVSLKSLGFLDASEDNLRKAIELKPQFASAYNNYGNLLNDKADLKGAQECFVKAIDIEPSSFVAYWNLHSTVNEAQKAKAIIEQCLQHSPLYKEAIFTLAGMNAFSGKPQHFRDLMSSGFSDEPILRSINWVLSLPSIPELHFNRWSIFDRAAELSERSRPFYEFGVWMGDSFKYLMRHFQKGFGFDTFEGLPEDWRSVPKGSYSSFGKIPKIKGGEFIVGRFEESLPNFFEIERPKASLINFDADLYASTLCALSYCNSVIDEKTILIFDEFIINYDWEKDEFKASNEFCEMHGLGYEVIAISLYTKQVMLRLTGI